MLAVVLLGGRPVEGAQLDGGKGEALALEPADHLADEATTDTVGLDEDEGALGGHAEIPSGRAEVRVAAGPGLPAEGQPTHGSACSCCPSRLRADRADRSAVALSSLSQFWAGCGAGAGGPPAGLSGQRRPVEVGEVVGELGERLGDDAEVGLQPVEAGRGLPPLLERRLRHARRSGAPQDGDPPVGTAPARGHHVRQPGHLGRRPYASAAGSTRIDSIARRMPQLAGRPRRLSTGGLPSTDEPEPRLPGAAAAARRAASCRVVRDPP